MAYGSTPNISDSVPVEALSVIFRAKVCAGLKKRNYSAMRHAPSGRKTGSFTLNMRAVVKKVLDYLGRYVFRIAIANSRIESIDNGQIRFHYRDNQSQQIRHITLPAIEFIGRFLQHVLPRGCVKVRYYGIWSPSRRQQLEHARTLLPKIKPVVDSSVPLPPAESPEPAAHRCPLCRQGILILVQTLTTQRSHSP
jgi:hypothetical protein